MKVIKELYIIPDNVDYILYAPLKKIILTVNGALIKLLINIKNKESISNNEIDIKCLKYLEKCGIINSEEDYPDGTINVPSYSPTSVTLLPTSDCNLNCIYCYADSGKRKTHLTLKIALEAVNFAANNAINTDNKTIQIGFLGGGEPFLRWSFIKNVIEYTSKKAENNALKTYFTAVTNGVLTDKKIEYIIKYFNYLNISLDGTKELNDKHRLFKDANSSFTNVIHTVKKLTSANFNFALRATISSLNVNEMEKITHYFCSDLGVKRIHYEPLFACGRAKNNHELVPDLNSFVLNFIKCIEVALKYQAELFCSAIRLDILAARFCGALDQNFYIVPGGYVTACTEVSDIKDPMSDIFFIGKYNKKNENFDIWHEKRNILAGRTVNNIEDCSVCLSKWHCAGGCPVKSAIEGDLFKPSKLMSCEISKELTLYYIKSIAHGKKGFVPRIKEFYC